MLSAGTTNLWDKEKKKKEVKSEDMIKLQRGFLSVRMIKGWKAPLQAQVKIHHRDTVKRNITSSEHILILAGTPAHMTFSIRFAADISIPLGSASSHSWSKVLSLLSLSLLFHPPFTALKKGV